MTKRIPREQNATSHSIDSSYGGSAILEPSKTISPFKIEFFCSALPAPLSVDFIIMLDTGQFI